MTYCPECSVSVPEDVDRCPTCGASLEVSETEATAVDEPQPPKLDLDKLQATLSASLAPTYEILKPIGHGGMGAIFLAKEPALKRLVAVKVLAPQLAADNNARVRFEREARAAAAISHPNVVRVFAVGETKRTKLPYIIMQHVDGPNLEEWRLRKRRLSERDARRVIGEVAAALAAAHERNLVHRDVKPSNILLEIETGRAYVADFGVSAALASADDETRLTRTGAVVGTPTYMSPEQSASEQVSPSSDVYSLGIVAYELVTGKLPFHANSAMGWAAAHLRDTPTPTAECRPEISPALAQLVDRCLSKESNERPTAEEIARGLLPSLDTEIEWPPPGLNWLMGRGRAINRLALIGAAGAGIATVAWSFVPEVLSAGAGWLEQFEIAAERPIPTADVGSSLSNAAVLAMFVWQVAFTVGLVAYVAAGLAFLISASRAIERAIRQRGLGWKVGTLLDLAVDHDGRTGVIMTGNGDFASFHESRRKRILQARRGIQASVAAGSCWIMGVFAVRTVIIVLGLSDPGSTNTMLDTIDSALILVPGVALVVCGIGFRLWESQILGKVGRRHSFDAEPDDVSRWYESLRTDDAEPAAMLSWRQDRIAVWGIRAVRIVMFLLVPVVAIVLALGGLATLTAGQFAGRFGPGAAELLATLDAIDREDPIGTSRSLWSQYLPARESEPADEGTELLRRLRLSLPHPDAVPAYGNVLETLESLEYSEGAIADGDMFSRSFEDSVPSETVELLRRVSEHPRSALYRALSTAAPIDSWDFVGTSESTSAEVPLRPLAMTLMEAARANTLSSLLALSTGNLDSAFLHLGENLAIGEHLLNAPSVAANILGMRIIASYGLSPLSKLERAGENIERALRLERAAERVAPAERFGNAAGLTPDPSEFGQFLEALTDERVAAGYRLSWLRQGWGGLCAHPREILLGPSSERRTAMRAAVDSMRNIPQIEVYAALYESAWRWPATPRDLSQSVTEQDVRTRDRVLLGTVFRMLSCIVPDGSN